MSPPTRILIFAKRPVPGRVKTRLVGAQLGRSRRLEPEDVAHIYQAFLNDLAWRLPQHGFDAELAFCLPDRPESQVDQPISSPALHQFLEPKLSRAGNFAPASSIGEAIDAAIQASLALGFQKVIVLGSDLPHIAEDLIVEAIERLDAQPLILGDDGGGCYLIGASAHCPVLSDPRIRWSCGEDFEALQRYQIEAHRTFGILSRRVEDIDDSGALERLYKRLCEGSEDPLRIPSTWAILRDLARGSKAQGATVKVTLNGELRSTSATTLGALLLELDISTQGTAFEVNEEVIPRARVADWPIQDGDLIELVRLVGGG